MTKIQFGHGGHILGGWLNLEQHQADITKPLAFKDNSVDFILIEHCLEHVTPQEGYRFLKESRRILKSGGVIRVIVPSIDNLWIRCNVGYLSMLREGIKKWWPDAGISLPNSEYVPTDGEAVET